MEKVINNVSVLLKGNKSYSYDDYRRYLKNIKFIKTIKSVHIPTRLKLIEPNKEYPNGALRFNIISGKKLKKGELNKMDMDELAKSIATFLNELHKNRVPFDKTNSIIERIDTTLEKVIYLKDYMDDVTYKWMLKWYRNYKNYLIKFDEYSFIHSNLVIENFIFNDNNELVGIVGFEKSTMGDPAYDIASLYYLGSTFIRKVLKYYKHEDDDLISRVNMLIILRKIENYSNLPREEMKCFSTQNMI